MKMKKMMSNHPPETTARLPWRLPPNPGIGEERDARNRGEKRVER